MITIEAPHMGLNSPDHHVVVQMWNTWLVPRSDSREHIIGWVKEVARGAPGGKLKNVVFSCHGNPAYVQLGQGFDRSHSGLFSEWVGLVDKIWFRSCLVARIQTPGAATTGDGNLFCSEVARAARCYVVASTELQAEYPRTLPYGRLDTYEGLLLSYGPDGNVTWSQRYPSTYNRGAQGWHRNPD